MRQILLIIIKEFKQISRNRILLPLIFMMPIIQLLILANAATFEIKEIKLAIIDNDKSQISKNFAYKLQSGDYFKIIDYPNSIKDAEKLLETNSIDLYIYIPNNFERNLAKEHTEKIGVVVNAIDGSKAGVSFNYLLNNIAAYQSELTQTFGKKINLQITQLPKIITSDYYFWYNLNQNYKIYIVPGLLVLLITIVGIFLTAINIVREKEIGTIEQINVTPIKKIEFIIGKLLPFWLIGMFELIFGMIVSRIVYHIPVLGNPLLIIGFGSVYLTLVLGIGLLISTASQNQQQAVFISWFFMLIFVLLSGLFTPIENMPPLVQNITFFNPLKYFIEVIRLVMLKGSTFSDIKLQFFMTALYALVINSIAILVYRKSS
jgi:ABC-2 type transport system permease protein